MSRDERELDWRRFQRHEFVAPSADLAAYVSRYWMASWSYDRPYRQLIRPSLSVHLSFRDGLAEVHGVTSRYVHRELVGEGHVLGVEFRAGCFRPFLGAAVRSITDRVVPADPIFPGIPAAEPSVEAVEALLRDHRPEQDPNVGRVCEMLDVIAGDPAIKRIDLLAQRFGTTPRHLQRLFAEYVGIGPNWTIRRYRLEETTDRMASGATIDWPALAAELGYADQSHLVRDFSRLFGESPTRYADRY